MKKYWKLIVLSLNITGCVNMFDMYLNLLFGFHLAICIYVISDIFKLTFNLTLNNNTPNENQNK